MRTALRPVFSGRRPPIPEAIAVPDGGFWSLLALGARRPPLARRLTDPRRRLPPPSRIVLRPSPRNLP
jgi:hypothetical protein